MNGRGDPAQVVAGGTLPHAGSRGPQWAYQDANGRPLIGPCTRHPSCGFASLPGGGRHEGECAVGYAGPALTKRGRVFDQGTSRWYKDGFAPFQLPEFITAWCGRCGNETLTISARGAVCATCSPATRAD